MPDPAGETPRELPGFRPVPDPTLLTTEQLLRAIGSERDYVDGQIAIVNERLRGIDIATQLLSETLNRVPTEVTKDVGHLRQLMIERFNSIATQFAERDTRQERESRDNKVAVDAAFAAQKEAAAKQDEANSKAINKSEAAMAETVNKLSELFKTTTDSLADKIDDLKQRTGRYESTNVARATEVTEKRLDLGQLVLIAGLLVSVIVAAVVVASFAKPG